MSPRTETLLVAISLFDKFGYEPFKMAEVLKDGLIGSIYDINHIQLFNLLQVIYKGGRRTNKSYCFTKNPHHLIS